MKTCICLAWPISPSEFRGLHNILAPHDIRLRPNPFERKLTEDELILMLKDVDGVIAGGEPYTARILYSSTRLKVIARLGVGYENIDLKAATDRGVTVTWTPIPEMSISLAEETFALILTLLKRIPYRDREMRNGIYDVEVLTFDAFSLTLGILGLGRIGVEVAKRARAFQMNLQYYDSVKKIDLERELNIRYVPLDRLLKESDIITIHTPLTPETIRMIGEKEFSLMKPGAYLVNTARGAIVDERALLKAIKDGRLAGAGLAVYSEEPPSHGHPFYKIREEFPNVVLVPNRSVGTTAMKAVMLAAANDLVSVLEGETPKYPLSQIIAKGKSKLI